MTLLPTPYMRKIARMVSIAIVCGFCAYGTEQTQLFSVHLNSGYLEWESQFEQQERSSAQTGILSYDDQLLEVRPKVHLDFGGSVYHTNLLDYDLAVELGLSYEHERERQPQATPSQRTRSDTNPLQFYNGRAHILKEKKLSGMLFGNYNLIRLDNGFFSRRLVYQAGYGAEILYTGNVVPWSLAVGHREEEETDTLTPRDSMQDELRFKASNNRGGRGRTMFDYLLEDFERRDFNTAPYSGTRSSARLTDTSYFNEEALSFRSSIYYSDIESTAIPSTVLTARELVSADHSDSLQSTYEYGYSTRESGTAQTDTQDGRIALRHQLYESLSSTVSADFYDTRNTAVDTRRYGAEIDESYTKRIGSSSRLGLGATLSQHEEDRTSHGTGIITIINESHTLTSGVPTLLNQPDALASSIVVTDPTGTILYTELIDYLVIQRGSTTEIQRIPTGTIPNGGGVLVTYDFDNRGSAAFTTRQGYYRFRLSLIDRLLSVYGHLRRIENTGEESVIVEDLTESVLGVETEWNWLNAGAEYQHYDSSLVPTKTVRLFQNATFNTSWRSVLRLSAEQSWTTYPDTNDETRRFYQSIAYRTQLTPTLSFKTEGGLYLERSRNNASLERDLLAADAELIYRLGKTLITASYEYRGEDYLNENRKRNTAYLRVRRNF